MTRQHLNALAAGDDGRDSGIKLGNVIGRQTVDPLLVVAVVCCDPGAGPHHTCERLDCVLPGGAQPASDAAPCQQRNEQQDISASCATAVCRVGIGAGEGKHVRRKVLPELSCMHGVIHMWSCCRRDGAGWCRIDNCWWAHFAPANFAFCCCSCSVRFTTRPGMASAPAALQSDTCGGAIRPDSQTPRQMRLQARSPQRINGNSSDRRQGSDCTAKSRPTWHGSDGLALSAANPAQAVAQALHSNGVEVGHPSKASCSPMGIAGRCGTPTSHSEDGSAVLVLASHNEPV